MDCRRDARLTGFGGSADFFGANRGCLPRVGAIGTFSDAYKENERKGSELQSITLLKSHFQNFISKKCEPGGRSRL